MHYPCDIDTEANHDGTIPGHDGTEQTPFEIVDRDGLVHATMASGAAIELTGLIPALARLAMDSRDASASFAGSLAGLGVPLTGTETAYLSGCAMRVLQTLLDEDVPTGPSRG